MPSFSLGFISWGPLEGTSKTYCRTTNMYEPLLKLSSIIFSISLLRTGSLFNISTVCIIKTSVFPNYFRTSPAIPWRMEFSLSFPQQLLCYWCYFIVFYLPVLDLLCPRGIPFGLWKLWLLFHKHIFVSEDKCWAEPFCHWMNSCFIKIVICVPSKLCIFLFSCNLARCFMWNKYDLFLLLEWQRSFGRCFFLEVSKYVI